MSLWTRRVEGLLLYFAWLDQRVQQFYNYHNVSSIGSYRTVVG